MQSPPKSPKKNEKKVEKKGFKKHMPKSSKVIVPAKKSTDIGVVWTSAHMKFKYGKSLLTVDDLTRAGHACVNLYNYYMQISKDTNAQAIVVQYKQWHFLKDDDYFLMGLNDLYDLFNLNAMDVSLLHIFTL